IAGPKDFSQREDEPLLAVQTEQHTHRAGILGFLDQDRQRDRDVFRIGQVELGMHGWVADILSTNDLPKASQPFTNRDQFLTCFGPTRRSASLSVARQVTTTMPRST